MYILTIPMVSYILMLLTTGLLVTLGVDIKSIDTVGIFMLYIQGTIMIIILRWLKRKVTK
jgi:hypothetical protein